MVIGGSAFTVMFDERRAPAAGVIAFRGLDLDDIGTQVGKRLTGPGAGQDAGQFDDLQARKGVVILAASFSSRMAFNSS